MVNVKEHKKVVLFISSPYKMYLTAFEVASSENILNKNSNR